VKLRELPGALILGLLASLLAHTIAFGDEHVAGGSFHQALCSLALAGGVGFGILLGLLAWLNAGRLTQGSILASRLTPLIPRAATVVAFAASSFFAIEALESPHAAVALGVIVLALVAASLALSLVAHIVVRGIAQAAVAVADPPYATRLPIYIRRVATRPRLRGIRFAYRRFARPPPQSMLA
jgi:hypothetical protein